MTSLRLQDIDRNRKVVWIRCGKVARNRMLPFSEKALLSCVNTTRPIEQSIGSSNGPCLELDSATVGCNWFSRRCDIGQEFILCPRCIGSGTCIQPIYSKLELTCGSSKNFFLTKAAKDLNSARTTATAKFSKSDLHLMLCDCSVNTNGGIQTRKKPHLFSQNLSIVEVI